MNAEEQFLITHRQSKQFWHGDAYCVISSGARDLNAAMREISRRDPSTLQQKSSLRSGCVSQ